MNFARLSHDGVRRVTLRCSSPTFRLLYCMSSQAMRSIVYVSLCVARWFAAVGALRSSLLFRLSL